MTVRVATVLSARDWEPNLVAQARETASIRIVLRAFQPKDIESHAGEIDVVVASGDVSWVTPHQISTWCRLGFAVVGIHPAGDVPAASLLELGGAAEVLPDTVDVAALVQAIRFVAPGERASAGNAGGNVTAVVGPRGAPGSTEVACAYAFGLARVDSTVLIDADLTAPALAVRLGIAPRPDITDATDMVRAEGAIDRSCIRRVGGLDVIPGSHREGELPVRDVMLAGLVDAAAGTYDHVVLDVGTTPISEPLIETIHGVILVVDASPVGIVRAAQMTSNWFGPTPGIVINKVTASNRVETIAAVKRWTGLNPVAVIPDRQRVRRNSASGRPPDRAFSKLLTGVGGGA